MINLKPNSATTALWAEPFKIISVTKSEGPTNTDNQDWYRYVISRGKDPTNGRQVLYELTGKGKDLLPLMLAIYAWAEKYDSQTRVSRELAERIRTDFFGVRDEMLEAMNHSSLER